MIVLEISGNVQMCLHIGIPFVRIRLGLKCTLQWNIETVYSYFKKRGRKESKNPLSQDRTVILVILLQ